MEKEVMDQVKCIPQDARGSRADRAKRQALERKRARALIIKDRVFDARISQIFAEMLGSVCHTDNHYIEDQHEQTVRFPLHMS
jgi:hypothetical protein